MGRKPIDDEILKQIVLLAKDGKTAGEISISTGLSPPTVRNYLKKYGNWVDPEEQKILAEVQKQPTEAEEKPVKQKKEKTAKENTPALTETSDDPVLQKSEQKYLSGGSELLSKTLIDMLKNHMSAARSLISAEAKYQKSVEDMGLTWGDFINFSLEIGYGIVEEEYIKELEGNEYDRLLKMDLEEKLHTEEIEEIEQQEV